MRDWAPKRAPEFVGFTNFARALFNDPTFWDSLRNIMIFVIVVVPVQGGSGWSWRSSINQKLRGITTFRVIFFLPVVTSMVVIAMLWRFMYQKDGLINSIGPGLERRLAQQPVDGAARRDHHVDLVWRGIPHDHLALGSADNLLDLYEAASLDGAGKWQQFRNVTVPGLRGHGHIRSHHHHDRCILTVHADRRDDRTGTVERNHNPRLPHHPDGIGRGNVGYASALSLIFFIIVMAVTLLQQRLTREER